MKSFEFIYSGVLLVQCTPCTDIVTPRPSRATLIERREDVHVVACRKGEKITRGLSVDKYECALNREMSVGFRWDRCVICGWGCLSV